MDTAENTEIIGSIKDIADIISVDDENDDDQDQQPASIILLNC